MAKKGRPFVYQSDTEKPVTVSLRIPRDVYKQIERYVHMHPGMTLTEFVLDGIRLRLDTPTDPRDIILSDDNTVIQEVQEMIRSAVQAEVGKLSSFLQRGMPAPEAPAAPVPAVSHDGNTVIQDIEETAPAETSDISHDSNTVLQESAPRRPGRQSTMRQPIVDLLQGHPEGLSATELRIYLHAERSLSDILQGMTRSRILKGRKNGTETKYTLA